MYSSANFLILTVICAASVIHVSGVPIGKEDMCSALKNIEQQIPCDELKTSFKSGNCSEAEECLEKDKLDECFHGLIFNGTKYSADSECLQFYCNCFEGMSLTQEIPELDNSTMDDSGNSTVTMNMTAASADQDESSANSTETVPEMTELPHTDMIESNSTETSSEIPVVPDMLNIDVSDSNSTELDFEEMNMNNTDSMDNNTTSGKSGKYIRPQEPQTGNPGDFDTPNHRSGSRRPADNNPPNIVHETSTRNIYDTDHTEKDNLRDHQDHPHQDESKGHTSKATSHSHTYAPVFFLTYFTSLFVFS